MYDNILYIIIGTTNMRVCIYIYMYTFMCVCVYVH